MKKLILLFFIIILTTFQLFACEIRVIVNKESPKKESFKSNDIAIIDVEVQFIHRVCPLSINKTIINYENVKLISATDWKEVKPGFYSQQLKVKILKISDRKEVQTKISVERNCDAQGGYAVFSFNSK